MESKYTKLTAQQIQLIRRSWRSLRGINPVLLADIFYAKLFSDTPRLRKLFPKDMQPQYGKLVDMLNKMILQLDNPSMLEQEIEDMSRRHMEYGVRPAHYTLVGNALLWTLEKGLGQDWNAETAEAWKRCYQLITEPMLYCR